MYCLTPKSNVKIRFWCIFSCWLRISQYNLAVGHIKAAILEKPQKTWFFCLYLWKYLSDKKMFQIKKKDHKKKVLFIFSVFLTENAQNSAQFEIYAITICIYSFLFYCDIYYCDIRNQQLKIRRKRIFTFDFGVRQYICRFTLNLYTPVKGNALILFKYFWQFWKFDSIYNLTNINMLKITEILNLCDSNKKEVTEVYVFNKNEFRSVNICKWSKDICKSRIQTCWTRAWNKSKQSNYLKFVFSTFIRDIEMWFVGICYVIDLLVLWMCIISKINLL